MVMMIEAGHILWQVYLLEKHGNQTQNSHLKHGSVD